MEEAREKILVARNALQEAREKILVARNALQEALGMVTDDQDSNYRMGGEWGTIAHHLRTCIHYTESIEGWIEHIEARTEKA